MAKRRYRQGHPVPTKEERAAVAQVVGTLRDLLSQRGIKTEIISVARWSTSTYIRFEDDRLGKLRVGDHDERERLGYRWQVRMDAKFPYTDEQKSHRRYFYPPDRLERMVDHIANYYAKIKQNVGDSASHKQWKQVLASQNNQEKPHGH